MSRIVVVDDEPAIRGSVRKMLARVGHSVMECGNGLEAISLIERTHPDILITDMHMPGCDGLELIRGVRHSGGHQPKIILLSGADGQEALDQRGITGVTVLTKPFTYDGLLEAVAKASGPPAQVRVLVVDDQPDVCLGFRYMLEADGFRVADAPNGRLALDYLEKEPVDVMLMDIQMPEMDGLAVLRQLQRADKPGPRTIAMTGSALIDRAAALVEANQLGASAVLEKPITREQLLRTIHSVVGGHPQGH